nr:unnamed protein product [Callosobruchus analis]
MLLALTTGRRFQSLTKIDIDNIIILPTVIYIKISDKFKTSGLNTLQPMLSFKTFHECPEVYIP